MHEGHSPTGVITDHSPHLKHTEVARSLPELSPAQVHIHLGNIPYAGRARLVPKTSTHNTCAAHAQRPQFRTHAQRMLKNL